MKSSQKGAKENKIKKEKCWTVKHRTVRCTVRLTSRSREFQPTSAIIHQTIHAERRTVRCASQPTTSCHISQGAIVTWSTGQSGATHWTVRCPPEQETSQPRDSLLVHCWMSGVHQTEGNQNLPNGAPTTPRSLGAIKGTPRSMEHYTKHPFNILRHRETAITLELR